MRTKQQSSIGAAPTAPSVTGAPPVTAAPAQILSRRHTHIRDAVVLSCAGVTTGAVGDIAAQPTVTLGGVGLVAAGGVVGVRGHRTKVRHNLEDKLAQALAPHLLGTRSPDWRTVRLSRWSRGWPGLPKRITLVYEPGINGEDPDWRQELLKPISRLLRGKYKVTGHDSRECELRLKLDTTVVEESAIPATQERAANALSRQMPTSTVTSAEFDDEQQLTAITLSHEIPDKIANRGYRRRLEGVMTTMHEGRWRGVWDLTGDTVRFEQRPTLPDSVWLPVDQVPTGDGDLLKGWRSVAIPYSVNEDNEIMRWSPGVLPHWLIIGPTGAGKTSTVHSLLVQWTRMGFAAFVVDGKSYEFKSFHGWPNVQFIAETVQDQVTLIHRVHSLVLERKHQIRTGQVAEEDLEPILFLIDEFSFFRAGLAQWYSQVRDPSKGGDPAKPPTLGLIMDILRLARSLRVHLVISMQRPDASFFDDDGRDNLPMRTSLGRLSPQGSIMMWQDPAAGVAIPRSKTGRALTVGPNDDTVEVQTFRFPRPGDSDHQHLLDDLRPPVEAHPRVLVVPAEETFREEYLQRMEKEPPKDLGPGFRDYVEAQWAFTEDQPDGTVGRPDLDPLNQREELPEGMDATTASSATHLFMGGHTSTAAPQPHQVPPTPEDAADDGGFDPFKGYGPEQDVAPLEVQVGDLLEHEGTWVTVEIEPEAGLNEEEPDLVSLSWRSDDDHSGSVDLPDDATVQIRRPDEVL